MIACISDNLKCFFKDSIFIKVKQCTHVSCLIKWKRNTISYYLTSLWMCRIPCEDLLFFVLCTRKTKKLRKLLLTYSNIRAVVFSVICIVVVVVIDAVFNCNSVCSLPFYLQQLFSLLFLYKHFYQILGITSETKTCETWSLIIKITFKLSGKYVSI